MKTKVSYDGCAVIFNLWMAAFFVMCFVWGDVFEKVISMLTTGAMMVFTIHIMKKEKMFEDDN